MSTGPKRPTCGSCDCYRPDPTQLMQGFCHCLPPTPIFVNQNGRVALASYRPPVAVGEFCHQWRSREKLVPVEDAGAAPAEESTHGA